MSRLAILIPLMFVLGCASPRAASNSTNHPLGPGLHEFDLVTPDGRTRHYQVHVPKVLERPAPMLLVLHGGGGGAGGARESMGMVETAEAEGFVAVFPQGISGKRATARRPFATWNATPECCGAARDQGVDDVAFLRAVVGEVSSKVSVDAKRVYATGHSNGGAMALRLACEASDLVAAVAAVGAPGTDWSACEVERPVPVLWIHGAQDRCATFEGGRCGGCFERVFAEISGRDVPANDWACASVSDALAPWRERAGVVAESSVAQLEGGARCETWAGDGVNVRLCVDPALGHAWPGGAPPKMCRRRPNGAMCTAWMNEVGPASDAFDNGLQWSFLSMHTR